MTIEITVFDREGQQEDSGPFPLECTEAEAVTLRGLAKAPFVQLLDGLSALDSGRPDSDIRGILEAVEAFGDGAELEVEG